MRRDIMFVMAIFTESPFWSLLIWALCLAVVGLMVGTLMSRVVYHLPRAIEAAWQAHARETVGADASGVVAPDARAPDPDPSYTTADSWRSPAACLHCGAPGPSGWRQWLGVTAFALPGRCASCEHPVGYASRLLHWLTAAVFALCAWRYGTSAHLFWALLLCAALITLAFIDAQTSLLPDVITLPLLWIGLLVNSGGTGWTPLAHAVWGAVAGYACLWMVFHAFRLATGREGMGYGDFKLLAALGAWLGLSTLPWLLLAASLSGVIVGLGLRFVGRAAPGQPLPFGPYLSAAGIIAILWPISFPG